MTILFDIYLGLSLIMAIGSTITYTLETGEFTVLDLFLIPFIFILWVPLLIAVIITDYRFKKICNTIKHDLRQISDSLNKVVLYKTRKKKFEEMLYTNEDEE